MQVLIDPDALRQQLGAAPAPVLIDTGFDLVDTRAGEQAWRAGHLPGALYWHLERDLSGAKTGHNGRHPLPARADFALTVARAGITPATPVVLYDRQGGIFAARGWWLLRWLGHASVAVLDGGLAGWTASGGALDDKAPAPTPAAAYPALPAAMPSIDATELLAGLGRTRLVDARAPERFRGEVEPLDRAAGHIPGALNRFYKHNLDADGRFRPAEALRAEFTALLGGQPPQALVHQCGSGATACHNLLAMEHAGLPGSRLYAGSWSEWSSDPARPIAQG